MTKLDELLKQIRNEVGGDFISMAVAGTDGMAIARETIVSDKNAADETTSRSIMALQLAKRVCDKLKLGDFEEDMMTSDKVYVLMKYLGDGSYSWALAVTRNATLGTVRLIMEDYSEKVWDAIPR
jgi:predicted regulator of Ras-like GTPase activity (Roadblock/LC7/MglB family)